MWLIFRDSITTISGDYIAGNSWSGYKRIAEHLVYHIDVWGSFKKDGKVRPRFWSAHLAMNGLTFKVESTHPSCKSVVDASRWADKALTPEVLQEAMKHFASKDRATCLVKDDKPFFSCFGHPKWNHRQKSQYPYGEYYVSSRNTLTKERYWTSYRVFPYGYAGGSKVETNFEIWTA